MTWWRATWLVCLLWASAGILRAAPAVGVASAKAGMGQVNFARDIEPILSDKCYFCHGPDANHRKADLRWDLLDPKQGPFAPRDGYSIVVPGKPDDSVVMMRITADDADVKMPPPDSHRTLDAHQIDLIKRWIEQGAKWARHWSLEPPVRPELPAVNDRAWPRNQIDRFVLAKLESEGLKPSPAAPKRTLMRRVTFDLTGLPPTPEEVRAFLDDTSPDAYEKVVDRLLASPRYGEHMAWSWLDLARYADTNGYQNDPTRTMWPWRDWVVKAFNENMPYDQFVTWQLAGDLLPHATVEQKIASGFNRNHPYNGEGGRIPEETRVENVLDRTDTFGEAFLGYTIKCAKCHDHKFDPISQKEYYSLYAYFNQCSETGAGKYVNEGNVAPVVDVTKTPAQEAELVALKQAKKDAEERLKHAEAQIASKQKAWAEAARYEKGWMIATPVSVKSVGGATMTMQEDSSVLVSGASPDVDTYEVVLRTDLARVTGIQLEALPDGSLPQSGPGRSPDSGNFVLTSIEARVTPVGSTVGSASADRLPKAEQNRSAGASIQNNQSAEASNTNNRSAGASSANNRSAEADPTTEPTANLGFAAADATYSQKGFDAGGAIDSDPKTGWAALNAPNKAALSAVFRFAEPVAIPAGGGEIHLTLRFGSSAHKQHTLGRFRLSLNDGSALPLFVAHAIAVSPDQRSAKQKKRITNFYRDRVSTELKPLNDSLAAASKALADFEAPLVKVMVMDDATPRQTHVLTKASYDKPADAVEPGVPAVLNPLPKGEKNDRLALAHWLFDPANPLVARVTVNRYWQRFFGVGIVKTAGDFGVQGERPVNPDLLDWLAVQFRQSGWNIKAMDRLIVTSSTYRQSSKMTPAMHERDPENRLCARGPRGRLPSPVLRDQALAASGLLVEKIGGEPVKPYQPPGIWEEATFGTIKYVQDHGDALYRRSLYTFWRRIVGPAEFFDTSDRTQCIVMPSRTNTPLHALTTLNDTTYVEAARCLAQRIMLAEKSPQDRLKMAYERVLSRDPSAREQTILMSGLRRLEDQYGEDEDAARKLLAIGESKRDEKLDAGEQAAYTAICLEILNLDEALSNE